MADFSILAPIAPLRAEHLLPYAALVQWTAARRLWQGQTLAVDPHQMFAAVAAAGFRVPVATGVTLMPLRHPLEAALQARTLAAVTGHPVTAGFGPGATVFQESVLHRSYEKPLQATREYLTVVRKALQGEPLDLHGEYFTCANTLATVPAPSVEIGLGALRPRMAALGGELADVVVTWLTPASYVRDVLRPAVHEGAARVGRPAPRIATMVPVALDKPDRDMEQVVLASNLAHMSLPHYADMLHQAGIDVNLDDPSSSTRALVNGGAFVHGPIEEVCEQLLDYEEAGVDEVVLNLSGVCQVEGAAVALRELDLVMKAVSP